MRTLWAIMMRLSSFTPSSITVSPSAPRSIVVLAPISTSSPIVTLPTCGTFTQAPLSDALPNPSLPITTPGCKMQRAPTFTFQPMKTFATNRASSPITEPRSMTVPGPMKQRAPIRAPAPMHDLCADFARGIDVRIHGDRRRGVDARDSAAARDAAASRCAHRSRADSRRRASATGELAADFESRITAPARVLLELGDVLRVREKRDRTRSRLGQPRDGIHGQRGIAAQLAAESHRQFAQSDGLW